MNDANQPDRELLREYKRASRGITSHPFLSLYRDVDSFGVVELIDDPICACLLVVRWLIRGVSEAEARAVLEAKK